MASSFPINSTLNPLHHNPRSSPPIPLSVPSFALCGSQLREVFNPAFERSAREKRGRGTAILSLFFQPRRSSAALTHPLQSCSFLLFSSPFFFPLICLGSLFFSGMRYRACSPRHWQTSQIPVPREYQRRELFLCFSSLYCFVSQPDS